MRLSGTASPYLGDTAGAVLPRCPKREGKEGAWLFGRRDPVGLQLAVEMAPLDAEPLGGAGHVPLVGPQLAQDEGALEGLARLLERALALGVVRRRLRVTRTEGGRKVLGADDVAWAHDHE